MGLAERVVMLEDAGTMSDDVVERRRRKELDGWERDNLDRREAFLRLGLFGRVLGHVVVDRVDAPDRYAGRRRCVEVEG